MSSSPPMDERQMRKQQIRPRFIDLAEFDDDLPQDASSRRAAPGGSFSDWPPAATVVRRKPPTIASASTSVKSTEASTPSASSKATPNPTVEDAQNEQASTRQTTAKSASSSSAQPASQPRSVRFAPEPAEQTNEADAQQSTPPPATLNFAGSIIGTIQERPAGEKKSKTNRSKPSGSRFVVRRRMDEDLQKHEEQRQQRLHSESTPQGQEPGTGFPIVSHRDQIAPILPPASGKARAVQYSEDIETVEAPQRDTFATQTATTSATGATGADDEEWLDEDGKPMSAFRKSRLLRQGARPPAVRSKSSVSTSRDVSHDREAPSFRPDPTRDPGGGADIDAITAVLTDVSRENDQKLRQMSAAQVSEEVRSLESLFGKDVLEALRNRKSGTASQTNGQAAISSASATKQSTTTASTSQLDTEEGGPLAIRRQYFPAEPEGPNPSLEWMMPQPTNAQSSTELRFDFSGKIIQRGGQTDVTYLSGLHHHGDDQEAPGYTFSELMHLSRSTVAAQRQLALNVLGRICELHPAFDAVDETCSKKALDLLNEHALLLRARVISISRWLLGDRHFTVRSAALRCLTSAVRSLPSGESMPLGAAQQINFNRLFGAGKSAIDLNDQDGQPEASEVEISIQKDWATVMLDSNLLPLFLDRTDSVITSSWEAELALELLLRIASCSAAHASQVFQTDPARLCDFIVHLGLKMSWPPVPSDGTAPSVAAARATSLPSLTAVRLLHQGILSDRKIAESIVMTGSIEHLLRFVVTPPWKVEQDWASDDEEGDLIILTAYQVCDEVLQLFTSLASYGFFASVVARTWNLWQESSSWAMTQLAGSHTSAVSASSRVWVEEAKNMAAQRIFEILAAWTHCAIDPHQLMTAHDLTWTQVRDWMETVKDAAPKLAQSKAASAKAPAFGALCHYIDAWLRCTIGKEPRLLQKYLDSCLSVAQPSQEAVQHHLLQVLRQFSSAPTQAMALDEAQQACRACHRYLDLSRTLARAQEVSQTQSGSTKVEVQAASGNVMLQEGLALISCGPLWQALQSLESQASGRSTYRETFSNFVAASVAAQAGLGSDWSLALAAATRLDARHASRVAHIILGATEALGGAEIARTLRPLLLECIVGSNRLPEAVASEAVEHRDSTPLSQVTTLFKSDRANSSTEKAEDKQVGEEDEEDAEKDVDPITGNKLWNCPASGLPIRSDWPLLALDDLLHSANTAVFNRPDNLDADWKPSELDIVRATLKLAVAVFQSLLQVSNKQADTSAAERDAVLSSLPSPEQIFSGIMKVFMLEKDQPDTFTDTSTTTPGTKHQKATGVLTGRDLFRDPSISSSLTSLLDIADTLVDLRQANRDAIAMNRTNLDTWTTTTYGSSMSFYQFFTDLVGLWDAISFGDANFARVILTVANAGGEGGMFGGDQGIAVDFRRLVWNDYSETLRSVPPMQDGKGTTAKWSLSWLDGDVDMLEHYCRYLASAAGVERARETLSWMIAKHHVGAAARAVCTEEKDDIVKGSEKRVEGILKSLAAAKGEGLLRELMGDSVGEEDVQRLVARLGL